MAIVEHRSVYELVVRGSCRSQAIINRMHWIGDVLNNGSVDLITVLTAFRTSWRTLFLGLRPTAYRVEDYTLQRVAKIVPVGDKKHRIEYDDKVVLPNVANQDEGVVSGDYLPTFNATTIQKLTGKAGRRFRGSCRLGPVMEVATADNRLISSSRTVLQDAANQFWKCDTGYAFASNNVHVFPALLTVADYFKINGRLGELPPPDSLSGAATYMTQVIANEFLGSQTSRKERLRLM